MPQLDSLKSRINIERMMPEKTDSSDIQFFRQIKGKLCRSGLGQDYPAPDPCCFEQHFRRKAAAEYHDFVVKRNLMHQAMSIDFVQGIMPSDIHAEEKNALPVT